jgi:hypothetical protein
VHAGCAVWSSEEFEVLTHMPGKAQAQRSMKNDFDTDTDTDWEWLPNRILMTIN